MSDRSGDFIICPYCDSEHTNMCDYPERLASGDEVDMVCLECGKDFTATASAIWTFYTNKKEGKLEREDSPIIFHRGNIAEESFRCDVVGEQKPENEKEK